MIHVWLLKLKNKLISYFLTQEMSGEETCIEVLQQHEQIPPFLNFRKHRWLWWILFDEFLLNVQTAFSFKAFLMDDLSVLHFSWVRFLTVKNIHVTPSSVHLPLRLSWIACFMWILILTHCFTVMICSLTWVHAISIPILFLSSLCLQLWCISEWSEAVTYHRC